MCAARPFIERLVPAPKSDGDRLRVFAIRLLGLHQPGAGVARRAVATGLMGLVVIALATGIVVAGTPARAPVNFGAAEILTRIPVQVDPATLPPVTVGQDVIDFDPQLAGPGMQEVVVTLVSNLELENQAVLRHDPTILNAVDHGDRLIEMQARVGASNTGSDLTQITHYQFDSLNVSLLVPFGRQDGFSLGLAGRGTMVIETYDAAGVLLGRESAPFVQTFAVRRATGDRWLNVAVLP
jgi:hypothetical protein